MNMTIPTPEQVRKAEEIIMEYRDKHVHGGFLVDVEMTNPSPPHEKKTVRVTCQQYIDEFFQEKIVQALTDEYERGYREGLAEGKDASLE